MTTTIEGIKLIKHTGSVNEPDDPSFPYKLTVHLRAPEFMHLAWIFLYGGRETIIVRGMTREAIDEFVELNGLLHHPRLISISVDKETEA